MNNYFDGVGQRLTPYALIPALGPHSSEKVPIRPDQVEEEEEHEQTPTPIESSDSKFKHLELNAELRKKLMEYVESSDEFDDDKSKK